MSQAILLSTLKLKESTPIQDNVDDSLLTPYIYRAQTTHIQSILGTDLYMKILSLVSINTIPTTYKVLLDEYIQPVLIEYSFYEVLPFISLKITNKSIARGSADYLNEGDLSDLRYLRNAVKDMAEFQSQRLVGYLKANIDKFPEYTTNSGPDKMRPNSKVYFNGVYMGGGKKGC
jgi:hypothetical protein